MLCLEHTTYQEKTYSGVVSESVENKRNIIKSLTAWMYIVISPGLNILHGTGGNIHSSEVKIH